jgi:AraC family transcriptional regulator, transcriptional activator of pobA
MKYPRKISTEHWGKIIQFSMPNKDGERFFDVDVIENLRSDASDINAAITPHRHDFYQLIWCVEGNGIHILDFDKADIRGGRIFFCAPEQCHSVEGESKLPKGYGIMFNDAFISELNDSFVHEIKYCFFRRYNRKQYIDISPICSRALMEIVQLMLKECEYKDNYEHDCYCLHLLALFFITLKRFSLPDEKADSISEERILVHQFVNLVEKRYKDKFAVCDYARELICSESKLNRSCQKILHTSPLKVINKRKLDEAKRMLSFSRESVKDITFELGFRSQPHFVAFFKKNTGLCPNEFRKSEQKDS